MSRFKHAKLFIGSNKLDLLQKLWQLFHPYVYLDVQCMSNLFKSNTYCLFFFGNKFKIASPTPKIIPCVTADFKSWKYTVFRHLKDISNSQFLFSSQELIPMR